MPERNEYYVERIKRGNGFAYSLYEITPGQRKELVSIDAKRKVKLAEFNKKYNSDGNFRLYVGDKMELNPNRMAVDAYFQIGRLDEEYAQIACKNGVARTLLAPGGTIFMKRRESGVKTKTVELGVGATGVFATKAEIDKLVADGKLTEQERRTKASR